MSEYFDKFPIVTYKGVQIRDITRRVRFLNSSISNPFAFLPYTVQQGDKPEDVAYYYYGSTEYTWLVYLSNNIVDPYHDWPLTESNFTEFLKSKYQKMSGQTGYKIIDWTQNETITDNIVYYYKDDPIHGIIKLSKESADQPGFVLGDWTAYRFYDYEQDLNESKRDILLVEKKYLREVDKAVSTKIGA